MSSSSHVGSSPSSTAFSPAPPTGCYLTATPAPLLALICQRLQIDTILRLLRSCVTLQRLHKADDSFNRAAWSKATVSLCLAGRLHKWTLPVERCIRDSEDKLRIPLSLWQQAVPLQQWWETEKEYLSEEWEGKLTALFAVEPPTTVLRVGDEEHVVLVDTINDIADWMPYGTCYRSQFVLTATPHLQHLSLKVNAALIQWPSSSVFSLVPHLRSLRLGQTDSDQTDEEEFPLSIRDMLAALPSLTALHCADLCLGVHDMIHIAAHATLEHITLDNHLGNYFDIGWLRDEFDFDSDRVDEKKKQEEDQDEEEVVDGQVEQDEYPVVHHGQAVEGRQSDDTNLHRLRVALTRVIPSHRSITARLAFANFLLRQLRRPQSLSLLRYFREQIALLRSILVDQLATASAFAVEADGSATDTRAAATEMSSSSLVEFSPSSSAFSSSPPNRCHLTYTPPAVLALICQHLHVDGILRLLRSYSTLQRLSQADDSFNSVAWSNASVNLRLNQQLHDWALPIEGLICDSYHCRSYIPLSLWQQALPVIRYTVQQWDTLGEQVYESKEVEKKLKAALAAEQPTTLLRVGDQEHIVLVRSYHEFDKLVPLSAPCFRTHFVLTATPHLQHLSLDARDIQCQSGSFVSLVPHLRSLRLGQIYWNQTDEEEFIMSIRDMLAVLPSLTALHCHNLHLGIQGMIDIAAHATLQRITLDSENAKYLDRAWLGYNVHFDSDHVDEEEDEEEDEEVVDGQVQPHMAGGMFETEKAGEGEESDDKIQRLPLALTRVVPSHSSITARLALANFLHRQVRRNHTPTYERPLSVLRHFRQQIAVLRSILLDQLTASSATADSEISYSCNTKSVHIQ